jgi:hypothetical protein
VLAALRCRQHWGRKRLGSRFVAGGLSGRSAPFFIAPNWMGKAATLQLEAVWSGFDLVSPNGPNKKLPPSRCMKDSTGSAAGPHHSQAQPMQRRYLVLFVETSVALSLFRRYTSAQKRLIIASRPL